jgi:hypothetical protein
VSEAFEGRDATAQEAFILHTFGFHEVKGLDGVWQRGKAGSVIAREVKEPEMFTVDEALQQIKKERQERSN